MNEKTKQILRYVACGVGGLALGIGLLGGLAMCASSGNRSTAESVNTIITKKNQAITTHGGYAGYSFTLPCDYDYIKDYAGYARVRVYDVDTSTFTLTAHTLAGDVETNAGLYAINTTINNYINTWKPDSSSEVGLTYFLSIQGYSDIYNNGIYYYWFYGSFLTWNPNVAISPYPFVGTNIKFPTGLKITETAYAYRGISENPIIQYGITNQYYVYGGTPTIDDYNFQDAQSYYKELGYGDGYEQGDTDGYNTGYWAGYNEGIGTASSFTDITANLNAVYDLTPMGVGSATWQNLHGLTDVKIYSLLQFFDNEQDTWDAYIVDGVSATQPTGTRTMYVDVAKLNSSASQTIGRAIYNNASTISLQEVSTAHFEFAQIRNVVNRSLSLNLLLLTGWTNDNTAYQAGYQAGLKDGFEGTNTNNVFSLFTSAFNAVGGFFNLKVFGFLPLYWFFLTPLFVALITLLLRMVKH